MYQCFEFAYGSGSVYFWASRIRIRIRTKMSRIPNTAEKQC